MDDRRGRRGVLVSAHVTIAVPARRYGDEDDSLAAAAADVAARLGGLEYSMAARWETEEREHILLDIPADRAPAHVRGERRLARVRAEPDRSGRDRSTSGTARSTQHDARRNPATAATPPTRPHAT